MWPSQSVRRALRPQLCQQNGVKTWVEGKWLRRFGA